MATLRQRLVRRLGSIPGVEDNPWPGRDDGFSALYYNGKEFAHFHNDNELDLRLTKDIIKREGLSHYTDSINHPKRSKNSPWIELRFDKLADVEKVVRLVKLALSRI